MAEAFIVDAVRTPVGKRGGALARIHPGDLGAHVLRALVERNDFDAARVDDVIFGHWFEATDRIEAVEGIEHGTVVDRQRVGYRFRVKNDEGTFTVEQQAYLGVQNDRIAWLRIMCSGYRPVEQPTA